MLDYLFLFAAGFVAWIVSTIGGGGGALLLVPLIGFIAGTQAVAPVATLATLVAGSGRAFVFWKEIEWSVVKWGLPGALLGGFLGAVLFATAPAEWVQIFVGLFLVSTVVQYRFGRKERTFEAAKWWFFPAELITGFLDGLIGAVGPVMNTLYLNAGITKERMIGTKTAVSLPTHLVKIGTYTTLGAMAGHLWLFGLAAGLGALISNWMARRMLKGMSDMNFRAIVVGFMALSGVFMIWEQRQILLSAFGGGLSN
ncbi:sulfite exporter TauE/SafE family protein [Sinorhizobium meliloti]|uniref:sulfite exporter TauE/SafE family protein n=1 Tax=Rhizobium meliloti TaxID=382 RepID=UPI000FD60DCA|nr:sulfite exporter TauE/SafE family protein [Sinorhizobium meliloti]RVH08675.1 sulfite exporter TauE/SafE family protein [Sinorhizobium meliloti]